MIGLQEVFGKIITLPLWGRFHTGSPRAHVFGDPHIKAKRVRKAGRRPSPPKASSTLHLDTQSRLVETPKAKQVRVLKAGLARDQKEKQEGLVRVLCAYFNNMT